MTRIVRQVALKVADGLAVVAVRLASPTSEGPQFRVGRHVFRVAWWLHQKAQPEPTTCVVCCGVLDGPHDVCLDCLARSGDPYCVDCKREPALDGYLCASCAFSRTLPCVHGKPANGYCGLCACPTRACTEERVCRDCVPF